MPDEVPLFALNNLNNQLIKLKDLRGKVVMINFWATWCTPCVIELPAMAALKESFAGKPFEILAINLSEDPELIKKFFKRNQIELNFPVLIDTDSAISEQYKVKALPATLLVDRDGMFAFGGVGAREWNSEEVKKEILPLFE